MNYRKRARLATLLASAAILASCATGPTPPRSLIAPAPINASKPALACAEFPPIAFAPGKPGATWADVLAAGNSHPDDPLAWARGVVGDTKSTREIIADYAARRRALGCRP